MKNNLTIFLSLSLLIFTATGCGLVEYIGSSESSESASEPEKKTEAVPSGEVVKVGITECDELATYINDNSEAIEGSIVAKGIVYVYKNLVLEKIKEGIKNMSEEDKKQMAKVCAKSLEDLKKSINK